MAKAAEIQVTGLKELRKSLKGFETDTNWRPALRLAYTTIAQDVAAAALAKAGGSRMGSAARATIQGKGTVTNASIRAGGNLPYYGGFEFGSARYRQFPAVQKSGYHLYPAIEDKREQIQADFMEQIDRALGQAQL